MKKNTIEELNLTDEPLVGAEFDEIPPESPDDWKWDWIRELSIPQPGVTRH